MLVKPFRGFLATVATVGLFMTIATTAQGASFCPGVPGTAYNSNAINWALNDAARALRSCSRANWTACRSADRNLDRADVAIDQMLRYCVGRNCRKYQLGGLLRHAGRLAGLSRTLQARSGMRRTYENTLGKIAGWERTPFCSRPQPRPQPGRVCAWSVQGRGCFCVFTNDPRRRHRMPPEYCSGRR